MLPLRRYPYGTTPVVFYTRPSPSSIVRAWQAQLGPLDGRGFETPWVQKYAPPQSIGRERPLSEGGGVRVCVVQTPRRDSGRGLRATRRTSLAVCHPLPNPNLLTLTC